MLTFSIKAAGDVPKYDAAELVSVSFDIRGKRIVVVVAYGIVDLGTFVKSSEIKNRVYVIDDALWTAFMTASITGPVAMRRLLETGVWAALKSMNKEDGVVV